MIEITDFGAVGDGKTDDSAAIQAAIGAMGKIHPSKGGTVHLPPGRYYCAFAPGKGIQVWHDGGSPAGGAIANGTVIRDLQIESNNLPLVEWQAGTTYNVGEQRIVVGQNYAILECIKAGQSGTSVPIVYFDGDYSSGYRTNDRYWKGEIVRGSDNEQAIDPTGSNLIYDIYFECTTAGTTGSKYPQWNRNVGGNTDAPEGTARFTTRSLAVASSTYPAFQGEHLYAIGDRIVGTTDGQPITQVFFECTTTGTSSATPPPLWNLTVGGKTNAGSAVFTTRARTPYWISDGSVVWAMKVHTGIYIRTRTHVENVSIFNTTNAGIHIRAGGGLHPGSNANGWSLSRCYVVQCGIGILVAGGDTNVGTALSCNIETAGYQWPGNGGVGIYDSSFLGCTWLGCQVANDSNLGGGNSYRGGGGAQQSVFIGCYSEGNGTAMEIASKIDIPAIVIGGDHGAGFTRDSNAVMLFPGSSRNIVGRNPVAPAAPAIPKDFIYSYPTPQDGWSAFNWAYQTDIGYTGIGYSDYITPQAYAWPKGWWTLTHNGFADRVALAISGERAVFPGGTSVVDALGSTELRALWSRNRIFIGTPNAMPPSIGFGTEPPTSGTYAHGSVVFNQNAAVGQPMGWQYDGTQWRPMANL
jgi:hypothetical protein